MREDSCPEFAVPGISRWLFTVWDKKILLFPFQFLFIHFSLHAMQKYVCCSSGYFILSMSSCLGLLLVLWKRNQGCRWRLVTSFTSHQLHLSVLVRQCWRGPGKISKPYYYLRQLSYRYWIKESPGNIHSMRYKLTYSPATCSNWGTFLQKKQNQRWELSPFRSILLIQSLFLL